MFLKKRPAAPQHMVTHVKMFFCLQESCIRSATMQRENTGWQKILNFSFNPEVPSRDKSDLQNNQTLSVFSLHPFLCVLGRLKLICTWSFFHFLVCWADMTWNVCHVNKWKTFPWLWSYRVTRDKSSFQRGDLIVLEAHSKKEVIISTEPAAKVEAPAHRCREKVDSVGKEPV